MHMLKSRAPAEARNSRKKARREIPTFAPGVMMKVQQGNARGLRFQPRAAARFNGVDDQAAALEAVGRTHADDARRAGPAFQLVQNGIVGDWEVSTI